MDKTFFSAKLNQETPPSVIHGWKATDLPFMMVKRKKYFFHPVKRQIFGDASGQTSALILTVCHMLHQHQYVLPIFSMHQNRYIIFNDQLFVIVHPACIFVYFYNCNPMRSHSCSCISSSLSIGFFFQTSVTKSPKLTSNPPLIDQLFSRNLENMKEKVHMYVGQ